MSRFRKRPSFVDEQGIEKKVLLAGESAVYEAVKIEVPLGQSYLDLSDYVGWTLYLSEEILFRDDYTGGTLDTYRARLIDGQFATGTGIQIRANLPVSIGYVWDTAERWRLMQLDPHTGEVKVADSKSPIFVRWDYKAFTALLVKPKYSEV